MGFSLLAAESVLNDTIIQKVAELKVKPSLKQRQPRDGKGKESLRDNGRVFGSDPWISKQFSTNER